MRLSLFLMLVYGLISNPISSQVTAPSLRCISVVGDGSQIKLDWIISSDGSGQFSNYEVMLSVSGNVFVNVANLNNRLQNSYTHTNANFGAGSTDYRYYIVTVYNDGSIKRTATSDTLRPMVPSLTINQNISGQLTWNPIHTPPLASSLAKYHVDRRFQAPVVWNTSIANPDLGTEVFNDNVARCNDEVFYRIRLEDQSGCESVSAVINQPLVKTSGPAPMGFNSISVNKELGHTELTWDKHPEKDTKSYELFYVDANGKELSIANVSENTTVFKDLNARRPAFLAPQCYRIAPVDSCKLTQGATETHCTMHLTRTFDPCEGEVSLTWTPYEGWPNGIKKYEIYMALNNGPFSLIDEVDGKTNEFVISNISAINTYAFYITATSQSGSYSSTSNLLGTKFDAIDKPQYIRLRSASVNVDRSVDVNLLVDRKAKFKHIALYRAYDVDGPFKKVKIWEPVETILDSYITITDTMLIDNQMKAYYYAIVVDDCGKPIVKSDKISTIFLEARGDKFAFETDLSWNRAMIWDTAEDVNPAYYVYYGLNKNLQADYFASSKTLTRFTHQFDDDAIYSNEFCYRVELRQNASELYPKEDLSYSNLECFVFEPEYEIPNAFTPNDDGINEIWKPEIIYGESGASYLLQIFDQWGKIVFETTDPNEGWNGRIGDEQAPIGSYVFKFKLLTDLESEIHEKGSFTLLR